MNGCLTDRSSRIQVPSSELFICHLCAMCWSLLQWPSLLQSSFRSPPLFKYKHLLEWCLSYLENENCQFMCWSCANSQGGGMMEGRASLKRCSQSGARHKPLQRVSVVHGARTICRFFSLVIPEQKFQIDFPLTSNATNTLHAQKQDLINPEPWNCEKQNHQRKPRKRTLDITTKSNNGVWIL